MSLHFLSFPSLMVHFNLCSFNAILYKSLDEKIPKPSSSPSSSSSSSYDHSHHSHHSHHSSHKASFKKLLLKLDVKFALPMFNGDVNPKKLDNWI
jgi:hypothetical protein